MPKSGTRVFTIDMDWQMIFKQFFHTVSSTYTYLIADEAQQHAILIDPVLESITDYLNTLNKEHLKLIIALDTHVHADHITGIGALQQKTGCLSMMGDKSKAKCVSKKCKDGDIINVGKLKLEAIYTPGHTDDSFSFLMPDRIFTGDTLLIRGTGRTDFQNGDPYQAYDSLFHKLLRLPDTLLVYPAHDYHGNKVSTIGEEKRLNPRLQVNSAHEYADMMNHLNLPAPKLIDIAVPANLHCGLSDHL